MTDGLDKLKVTEFEERIAHLSRSVDDLSDVVARQDQVIMRLERHVEQLRRRAAETEAMQNQPLANQRPPHW